MLLTDPTARPVAAHRGDRARAPENTMVAFTRALDAGADAIEFDVRLTADGHVIVMHDATVDRTTNGTGTVADFTLAALRELDAGARWSSHEDPETANGHVRGGATPFANAGHAVPLFAEVLDAFPSVPMIVECKTVSVSASAARIVIEHNAIAHVLIGAFPGDAIHVARRAGLATIATRAELLAQFPRAALRGPRRAERGYRAIAMPPKWGVLPLPVVGYARSNAVPVHVWTVNDPARAVAYWRGGVCGILTDDPSAMVAARSGYRESGIG